ncbi:MAG: DUF4870 domain-containing protein [Planctomycetota bacterium]|nr:DUF4870 domain-containing protein [Planctomycetota bacterium]
MTEAPGSPPSGAAPAGKASVLPPDFQTANASKDDRTMAMIAHLLGLVGFLGPLILFFVKKDGASKFLLFHIKQALFYQVAVLVAIIALVVLSIVGGVVTGGVLSCVCMPITGLVGLGSIVYLVIGAIQVNGGKDFEYFQIGPWVRKSM